MAASALSTSDALANASDPCAQPTNPIVCENSKPGTPMSQWDVQGTGDPTIQGFATSMSVNVGQTITFKIKTDATSYHIDILRLGYYQGDGARLITTIQPSAQLPQTQPDCLTDSSTGLIDCGNWGVSASWTVPTTAVSGVYIAHLVRDDTGGDSQIPFVVRDDASHSGVLVQTNDETWQAYNDYGGNSLYTCTVACPPGKPLAYKAAYAVSYNRPWEGSIQVDGGRSYFWYAEYQMVRWLEENGYDVSYTSEVDIDNSGALLNNHKVLLAAGHDEYWSANQRAHVTTARDAGLNLAFFTGNEIFWKTRYAPSIDGSNTPSRTVVSYKETHFNSPVDPQDPATWTGSWRDPRFSPPADGGNPENSLGGQYFVVNAGTTDITVPSTYSDLRLWRNTQVATLQPGQSLTLSPGTGLLGYEWDIDDDNGFRPPGEFDLSSTTATGLQIFTDYGSTTVNNGTETHHLTMYRAPGGALVFGAGTVQWSWGLDNTNAWHQINTDPSRNPPDPNVEQATVNLLADMGVQPLTLLSGLVPATQSADTTPPTSIITSPTNGASAQDGTSMTITGTATDAGGGVVAGVEVSTDGGQTWHPATGTSDWSYTWTVHGEPAAQIESRAVDDSGNLETPSAGVSVTVTCPCGIFGSSTTPGTIDGGDNRATEVGVAFNSSAFGVVTGVRFYKAVANTGTHIGNLWDSSGHLLATAAFTSESSSGWQDVTFSSPVAILPNTTYVASYYAPNGHYSIDSSSLYAYPPVGPSVLNSPPLHVIASGPSQGNGLYSYAKTSTFPTNTYNGANYWVDVDFQPAGAPGAATNPSATAGPGLATVTWTAPTSGGPVTSYIVTPYANGVAQKTTTISTSNGTAPATNTTISGLTPNTPYTFTVQAANPAGGGPISAQSPPVTPTSLTAPSAPTSVSATSATQSAQVTWQAPASNGGSPITSYTVTAYQGSAQASSVSADSVATSATVTGLTNGTSYTFTVTATNAVGSTASSATSAVTPQDTVFDFSSPAVVDAGDGHSVELGMKFTSDVLGWVNGIRFYKAAANGGTHVGRLWDSSGNLLASVTFANESASGWEQAMFSSPVLIQPNTTYVVGYLAPQGHYSVTSSGFGSPVDNPPLHGVANGTSANGLYAYSSSSTFPTNSTGATNYWVDVLFTPAGPPGQVTGVTASASPGAATVSWSAPANGGPVTSYVITPYANGVAQPTTTLNGNPPATTTKLEGLTGGVQYTFAVQATNASGAGTVSSPSNAVTPSSMTVPAAPTGLTARSATTQALVTWQAPSTDGGSPITGYTVTAYNGSTQVATTSAGASATSTAVAGLTNGQTYTFTVTAANSLGPSSPSAPSNTATPEDALFDFSSPVQIDSGDKSSTVVGMKFSSSVNGNVVGVRFYKAAANTGTHIGALWTSTGTMLASATFANESASGWQEVRFSSPVAITAGTTYVVSYLAPSGHYSSTSAAFTNPFTNSPLQAAANSDSANGVYSYSRSNVFPTNTYNSSNYWVDVLFQPS